jgi:predicted nucleotidyltransferase
MRASSNFQPTAYAEINALLETLQAGIQSVLGAQLVGLYLDGSLANGDFDEDSDIDFVAVTEDEIQEPVFLELQAMHDRIARLDSIWAIQLEGSYLSRRAIRRFDPAYVLYPNIERGIGERLKWDRHEEAWNVHRSVLCEHGIRLLGPKPAVWIDPIAPDDLRAAMRPVLFDWAAGFLANPGGLSSPGYQPYVVLSLCRALYTLQFGAVTSKRKAALWAQKNLDPSWNALIERAWLGRHAPGGSPEEQDVCETLALIRFALDFASALPA